MYWTQCDNTQGDVLALGGYGMTFIGATPVTNLSEGYACAIEFNLNLDPFVPAPPDCVATPVGGGGSTRIPAPYSAYTMFDVGSTPTQANTGTYTVTVIYPGCFTSTCYNSGGVRIICHVNTAYE
ncbi:MAG: hypothetical protein ACLPX5_02070 [Dissulfurispiraceae bacterium]